MVSAPYSGQKVSKKSVRFGEGKGGDDCAKCVHSIFKPRQNTGSCEIVEGPIDRDDWCNRFEGTEGSGTEPKGQT